MLGRISLVHARYSLKNKPSASGRQVELGRECYQTVLNGIRNKYLETMNMKELAKVRLRQWCEMNVYSNVWNAPSVIPKGCWNTVDELRWPSHEYCARRISVASPLRGSHWLEQCWKRKANWKIFYDKLYPARPVNQDTDAGDEAAVEILMISAQSWDEQTKMDMLATFCSQQHRAQRGESETPEVELFRSFFGTHPQPY